MVRDLLLLCSFVLVVGCSMPLADSPPRPYGPRVWSEGPDFASFATSGLTLVLEVAPDLLRTDLIEKLSRQSWPTTQEIEGRYTYVITVYVEEGEVEFIYEAQGVDPTTEADATPSFFIEWSPFADTSRHQRSAVLIRIAEAAGSPGCSEVFVSWKVQSRGVREETWRTTDEDNSTQPFLVRVINEWLREYAKCP